MTIPTVLAIIAGTVFIGRALNARGRLVDAVGYAARAAAIAAGTQPEGKVDGNWIVANVSAKLADGADCAQPVAVAWVTGGVAPTRYLDVTAKCELTTPILGAFLPKVTLTTVEATASMPIDYETQ